ncbi:hypothetical protein [Marinilabilia salmonicolor]|uniref:Oligoendopeptidase F n=1 Tax=Marinilabilia salmonicolor TaxID=989 RepID=A0A368V4P5_9BACT|nr:hypothetical protein [Marinilabilia salmonicolor]RCW36068.1 hypothetical protein DFO77_10932 [Marinilabilia salmonicolor]
MRTTYLLLFILVMGLFSCTHKTVTESDVIYVGEDVKSSTVEALKKMYPTLDSRIERGVNHAASLWHEEDGAPADFKAFCEERFVGDEKERQILFDKVSRNLEILNGHFNMISLGLQEPLHLKYGEIKPIDETFGGFNPSAHLQEDLYSSKIAFEVALNFPFYSLAEKQKHSKDWTRQDWAYARMGDVFTSRIPAHLKQEVSRVGSNSDVYISQYNIYAGNLVDEAGNRPFPEDMVLLSHWNLRDELKANYPLGIVGLDKQKMIYEVMQRIISQSIPEDVINDSGYQWNPYTNEVFANGSPVKSDPEPDTRYQQIINNFRALRAMDVHTPLDTYIKRKFEGEMEISQPEVEALFVEFLESDVLKEVGGFIRERLGRPLEPFDIWYDGFKARSNINEEELTAQTQKLYPDAVALDKDLPNLLVKLGFSADKARSLSDKITVDPARGSGHAWGAAMKGQQSHLRTRVPESGMNYKGYNIAIHEFGHNVEQTISLYDVDYYMLNGVPNTAFTEALAFIFQKRDLQLLGRSDKGPGQEALKTLDVLWSTYEIMGVSLLDMRVWKWLYAHPDATATELKEAVIALAKDIWNNYYAPVYGMEDEPVLAIYSHMVSYPLYLSAYAYGNIIEFQLEQHLAERDFSGEVQRIFRQGRLTPDQWMMEAVGSPIDVQPMLDAAKEALEKI